MRHPSVFFHWLHSLRRSLATSSSRSRRPRTTGANTSRQPWLECLEDRTLPSITLSPAPLPTDMVNVPYNQAYTAGGAVNTFYANQVVSYAPGIIPDASYNNPSASLGGLNPVVGSFGGANYYLTPFDPAYSSSDLVEVGAGGSLVLKLAQTASTNGYTVGVHTGFGLADADYPTGVNTDPATYIDSWLRQADVKVSADGVNWGELGTITFDNPSNYDAGAATAPDGGSPGVGPTANPGQPFLGSLSSFDGQNWQGTLATLNGSAGGTWLNLSGVTDENGNPIAGVNYIEFTVPNNPPLDPNTGNPEIMVVDAVVGTNNSAAISATGGAGNITLTVSNIQHAVPGLSVARSGINGLAISGTPTAAGTETFTVTATDSHGHTSGPRQYAITVESDLAIKPAVLPAATVNDSYSTKLTATGGSGTGYVFTDSDLPAGLTLSSAGLLDGMPTTPSSSPVDFTITVTDGKGNSRTFNESLTVDPPLALSPVSLPVATVKDHFSTQLTATGGAGAGYRFTAIDLPRGLKLSSAGLLSGTPTTAAGSPFSFTVTATDKNGGTVRATYSLVVDPALAVNPGSLPRAESDDYYSTQLTASGGSGAGYRFIGLHLPSWLTISSAGLLFGMPTTVTYRPFVFTVEVTDSEGGTTSRNYSLIVSSPAVAMIRGGSL